MSELASFDEESVGLELVWRLAPGAARPEESLLMALLQAVAADGSIAVAARSLGISYRHAWGLVSRWERHFGQRLVDMQRGRGSTLAPLGARLVELDQAAHRRLAPRLREAGEEMRSALRALTGPRDDALPLHASHDFALARAAEMLQERGIPLRLEVRGSVDSLADLADGRCTVAGFHCPSGALGPEVWAHYRPFIKAGWVMLRVVRRTQGIMLAAGNPKGISALSDLTRRGLRFVNRQAGAGTRQLLDLLLAHEGISPRAIAGYGQAEYTHAAVAAMIASGQADAGLGIEAAARQFGLDFVPLLEEDYFLVLHRRDLDQPAVRSLQAVLKGRRFRALKGSLPGYRFEHSGSQIAAAELAARMRPWRPGAVPSRSPSP